MHRRPLSGGEQCKNLFMRVSPQQSLALFNESNGGKPTGYPIEQL